jgi:hypothetical protein
MSERPDRRDDDDLLAAGSADSGRDTDHGSAYDAVVVSYDDAPDECTVFPVGVDETEIVTTWISAAEGSFVSLVTMR